MFKKGEVNLQSKTFISVQEVAEELGVSKSYAYKVVKQLNEELKQQGYLTVAGRVNAQYFHKKICYNERHV